MTLTEPRIRILEAAERLFAEFGIEGVSLRQIAAAAGQRNTSAVAYHFGSAGNGQSGSAGNGQSGSAGNGQSGSADNGQSGSADIGPSGSKAALVAALYEWRMTPVNARRLAFLAHVDTPDVTDYVRALVEPLAETLTEAESAGRPSWYLRFLAEAMRYPEYDPETVALGRPEAESIRDLISGLAKETVPLDLPPGVFGQRMRLLALLVITALADRERQGASGVRTDVLVSAGAAVLSAPC